MWAPMSAGLATGILRVARRYLRPVSAARLVLLNQPKQGININAMPLAVVSGVDSGSPVTYFVHADHLDRPIKMTNAAKSSVWDAIYKPYGETYSITGTVSLDARLPGQWFQLETGLAYNWHRHYDATTGRYVTPDPLGFMDGPSVYAYAGNSPQMDIDPEGLQAPKGWSPGNVPPPPPSNLPGGPWTWSPDASNSRGGTWRDPAGNSASWDDPGGHWDWWDPKGNPRIRYNRWGICLDPDEAHATPPGPPRVPLPGMGPFIIIPLRPLNDFLCRLNPQQCGS